MQKWRKKFNCSRECLPWTTSVNMKISFLIKVNIRSSKRRHDEHPHHLGIFVRNGTSNTGGCSYHHSSLLASGVQETLYDLTKIRCQQVESFKPLLWISSHGLFHLMVSERYQKLNNIWDDFRTLQTIRGSWKALAAWSCGSNTRNYVLKAKCFIQSSSLMLCTLIDF